MHIHKRTKIFIALISLFYCLSLIQSTYAKYVTEADASANITISRWNVLINNQDVQNNSNFSTTITPTFAGTSNIAANIIAPTSEGYFDIAINGNATDVSYQYTILITTATTSDVQDLVITHYTISGDATQYTYDAANPLTRNVGLNDSKTQTYRFYVKWNDDATQTMSNADDTTAAHNNGSAIMNISINVIQTTS